MSTSTPEFGFPRPSDQTRIATFPEALRRLSDTLEAKLPAAVSRYGKAEADRAKAEADRAVIAQAIAASYVTAVPMGTITDLNTLTTPTRRSLTLSAEVTAANHPAPGSRIVLDVLANTSGSSVVQRARAVQSNREWSRALYASTWTPWATHDLAARPDSDNVILSTATLADELRDTGRYAVASTSVARALSLPSDEIGVLEAIPLVAGTFQVWRTASGIWQRYRSASAGWGSWLRLAAPTTPAAPPPSASTGLKLVPVALSVGGSSAAAATSGAVRIPVHLNAPVHRVRVHVDNMNPRYGSPKKSPVTLGPIYAGTDLGDGRMGDPVQVGVLPDIPAGQSSSVSAWISTAGLGYDAARLLAFGWAGTDITLTTGGCWTATSPADAASSTATWTRGAGCPFQVWLEVETATTTPALAGWGSSSMAGVGATLPVHGSSLSRLCRRLGALPVHYAAAGDTLAAWVANPEHVKWTQWAHLARADAVIDGMGSNDIFGAGTDLATMQARHAQGMDLVRRHIGPVVYGSTMPPRTTSTGATEDVRRAYNAWLRALPNGLRDVFDYAAAVSADDEAIRPGMDADGIHVTDAGHQATADAVTRPVVPSSPWLIERAVRAVTA